MVRKVTIMRGKTPYKVNGVIVKGYGKKHGKGKGKVMGNKITAVKVRAFGFPDEYITKLKYSDVYTFGGVFNPAAQVWNINNLTKPDVTGAGHKPMYYNQLTPIYLKYIVFACRIKLELLNLSVALTICVLAMSDVNTSANTVNAICEGNYARRQIIGGTSGVAVKYMKMYMKMSKLSGQRHLDQDPTQYSLFSTVGGPTDPAFGFFKCITADGISVANLTVRATLTFYVKLKERTDNAGSM